MHHRAHPPPRPPPSPLPPPPPRRRVHGGAAAPGRHRRAPPRCPRCRRARGAVAMGRPFWTAAALGLVLAACQRCSGFYLPGVAPQDYAKVRRAWRRCAGPRPLRVKWHSD